ncbi:uncharacterized protein LOC142355205 [Convolutriloba macropyga]|uniref:uncharacterized protein LOC142355205 n=1 Tax=Convolutriloba macropyga TaxID=536237 RepID=UPI003F524D70
MSTSPQQLRLSLSGDGSNMEPEDCGGNDVTTQPEPNRSPRPDQRSPSPAHQTTNPTTPDQPSSKSNSVLNVASSLFTRSPRLPQFRNLRSETVAVDSTLQQNPGSESSGQIHQQTSLDSASLPTPTISNRASFSKSPSNSRLSNTSLSPLNSLPEECSPDGQPQSPVSEGKNLNISRPTPTSPRLQL